MLSRALRWPDPGQFILTLALAGMDACWLYLLARVVELFFARSITVTWVLPLFLLVLLELLPSLVGRRFLQDGGANNRLLAILIGFVPILFCVFIASPDVAQRSLSGEPLLLIPGVLLGLVAWGRGVATAVDRIEFNDIYNVFRLGIGVLVGAAVLTALGLLPEAASIGAALGPLALAFFACGLLGLAAGNLLSRANEAGPDDRPTRLNLRWGVILGGAVLLVLLAAGTGAAAGLDRFSSAIQRATGFVLGIVNFVVLWILYAISWLLFTLILDPLSRLFAGFKPNNQSPPPQIQVPGPPKLPDGTTNTSSGSSFVLADPIKWLVVIIVLLALAWIVSRMLGRFQSANENDSDVERESLGGWDLLWQQFLAWLRRLLRRDTATMLAVAAHSSRPMEDRPDQNEVLSVRRIYAALQTQAAQAGHPRRPGQTPDEFLRELQTHFPSAATDLSALTSIYDFARYGPPALPASLVAAANQQWQQAKAEMLASGAGSRESDAGG